METVLLSGAVNGIGYLHDAISTPIVRNTLVSGWLFYPHKVVKPQKKISSVYPNFQSVEEVYKTAMQSPDGIQLAHVSDSRYSTEVDLIQEISDGYNYCINKLGMYDQVLDMTISKE